MRIFQTKTRDLLQAGYRYALSLAHSEQDAEDLVQEAWLKLYEKRGGRFNKPLLFRTIRNLFIDQYRRNKLIVFEPIEENTTSPETSSRAPVCPEQLNAALQTLRSEEREAIYLNIVEGYTAREIADHMQCSRNTVLSLIHRGKQKLARTLGRPATKAKNQTGA